MRPGMSCRKHHQSGQASAVCVSLPDQSRPAWPSTRSQEPQKDLPLSQFRTYSCRHGPLVGTSLLARTFFLAQMHCAGQKVHFPSLPLHSSTM